MREMWISWLNRFINGLQLPIAGLGLIPKSGLEICHLDQAMGENLLIKHKNLKSDKKHKSIKNAAFFKKKTTTTISHFICTF